MKNDWTPVIRSLIARFTKAGFSLHAVDNGDERKSLVGLTATDAKLLATCYVCEVDQANLYLRKGEAKVNLFLVLGNEPFETVCDFGASESVESEVDAIISAFSESWEGRRCPVKAD